MYQDLSIIIPTYNSEKTIKKVLDYLIPLSKKGIKIFVSDNCSSDRTRSILEEYKDLENFKIIFQKYNTGFKNFKILLKMVKTNWVIPIGSDDYLVDSKFLLSEFQKLNQISNKKTVGMSFRSFFIYDKNLIEDRTNLKLCGKKYYRFLKFYLFNGCNSRFYGIIKTKLMLKYFPENNYYASDVVLTAQILEHGDWLHTKKVILHREKGLSSDQMKLRNSLGHKGLSAIFPPTKFLKLLFQLNSAKNILVKFAILTLYIRYSYGPIKHKLKI